ncbi:MAG: SWIM zinc finger family protein [Acidimicrobiales bacterium]
MARRPSGRPSARGTFGATWWGQAWIEALEQRARLDPNRLPRGRTYARHSRVGLLTVEPGEVRTSVLGSRSSAYRVRLRIRVFTDAEWAVVLDAIAGRAAHAAALLDGELSPGIVEDARDAGCDLLPGPGEVSTLCSCPDWANPCKHAAAVCYLVADRLDADPFELLLMRGRGRDAVLAGLRSRRAAAAPPDAQPPAGRRLGDAGVVARDVYAAWRERDHRTTTLPRPPLPPAAPGRPAPLVTDAPPGAATDAGELSALAADAVQRAWALATGRGEGGLSLSLDADRARRAHAVLGTAGLRAMAQTSGLSERQLVRLATAWSHGEADALTVLDESWQPPDEAVDEARTLLLAEVTRVRRSGQHLSLPGGVQLRLSRAGRWFPCQRRGGDWEVVGRGDTDPVAAYDTRVG